MAKEKLKIVISKNGGVEVTTSGFKGKACIEETQAIEQMIGSVQSVEKTAEYFKPDDDKKVFESR
jgi:hypothetical protein